MELHRTPEFIQALFPKIIWKHSDEKILITFDDGPDPVWTVKFSELLNLYSIKAIFFVVGREVKDPKLIRDLKNAGHEIGWHSQTHPSFFKCTESQIINELDGKKYVEDLIGEKIQYFRFPYGHFLPWQIKYICKENLTPVQWSLMVHEYKSKSSKNLLKQLQQVKKNDILLYHDKSMNVKNAFEALKSLIENDPSLFSTSINIAFTN